MIYGIYRKHQNIFEYEQFHENFNQFYLKNEGDGSFKNQEIGMNLEYFLPFLQVSIFYDLKIRKEIYLLLSTVKISDCFVLREKLIFCILTEMEFFALVFLPIVFKNSCVFSFSKVLLLFFKQEIDMKK